MRPGSHAAADGSFGRSSGVAAGRAAGLLILAVGLGVVLLNAADDVPRQRLSAGRTPTTETSLAPTTTMRTTTTTSPARQPRDVKVIPANGTTVAGAAGRARDALRAAGYNVLAPGDAKRADASGVFYNPGLDREARAVAEVLALPPTAVQPLPDPPPVSDMRGADVLVVVGPDLAERLTEGTTTTSSRRTTSTARSRTTTSTAVGSDS